MSRYLSALLCASLAIGVAAYNLTHDDRRLVIPMLDRFVGSDPDTLGWATVALIAAAAIISAALARLRAGRGA